MVIAKNEHVVPKYGGWMVRHVGMKKNFSFFYRKADAMEYAANNNNFAAAHKSNRQFKEFKEINEVYARTHKKNN